jgi:hypothetical protein
MYLRVAEGTQTLAIYGAHRDPDTVQLHVPSSPAEVTMVGSFVKIQWTKAAVQAIGLLLLALAIPEGHAQQGACGPPSYSCSRTDTQIIPAQHPPQLGDNANYYGGHSGVGKVAVDPAYGNRILKASIPDPPRRKIRGLSTSNFFSLTMKPISFACFSLIRQNFSPPFTDAL